MNKSPPNIDSDRLSSGDGDSSSPPYPRATGDKNIKEIIKLLEKGSVLILNGIITITYATNMLLDYEKFDSAKSKLVSLLADLNQLNHHSRICSAIEEIIKEMRCG